MSRRSSYLSEGESERSEHDKGNLNTTALDLVLTESRLHLHIFVGGAGMPDHHFTLFIGILFDNQYCAYCYRASRHPSAGPGSESVISASECQTPGSASLPYPVVGRDRSFPSTRAFITMSAQAIFAALGHHRQRILGECHWPIRVVARGRDLDLTSCFEHLVLLPAPLMLTLGIAIAQTISIARRRKRGAVWVDRGSKGEKVGRAKVVCPSHRG